ncbi:histone-lysine N-methyltransferase SETMAR [Trichonephila clavipes]|nr:histone-lysine N-methyltransferase SETMAR [Trichonephila clavipes]
MAPVFWDRQGILLLELLSPGMTINAAAYCQTLKCLRRAIQNKRRGMLTNGVRLLHDNARPHTALVSKALLKQFKREVLDHPPYSPDLAPSDFHLFRYLKSHLGGKSFHDDEEIKDEVEMWFRQQAATFYDCGIQKLVHRLNKCLDNGGVLPLTPTHRRLRLEWCHARENWTAPKWNQVVFRNQFRFNLDSDDNRVHVWGPSVEGLNPAFAVQRHSTATAGLMLWGTIACNTQSPLVLIRGTMTAQRYVHDILQIHELPLMKRLRRAIFQQDNARYHKAMMSQDCLCTVIIIPWPSRSSGLSPFGHIWDHLGQRVLTNKDKVTSNMERTVLTHHTELIWLYARSYRIVHSQ